MTDLGNDLFGDPLMKRSASFGGYGTRWKLTREWGPGPRALAIGCNPSDADALQDDPTSRWWNAWFRRIRLWRLHGDEPLPVHHFQPT